MRFPTPGSRSIPPRAARTLRAAPLLLALAACAPRTVGRAPSLADAERAYLDARDAHDRLDVARELGDSAARARLAPMGDLKLLEQRAHDTRLVAMERIGAIGGAALHADDDRRALAIMRRVLARDLANVGAASGEPVDRTECTYAIPAVATGDSALARLRERVYACYARAVQQVRLDDSTTDRLSVLAALGHERDPVHRRRLFLSLDAIWRTVNRDDGRMSSPYRVLVALEAPRWRGKRSPIEASLAPLGLRADSAERWLVRILEHWRDAAGWELVEPWDWWYAAGAAARHLDARLPLTALADVTERSYASLGASPRALGVHLDLASRAGKTPVAYTTFGARPRRTGGAHSTGEPWIVATYRAGGLDNLNELLHEMGHAAHIAAIDTRPAFTDWPDSDTFTEALAEVIAAEAYGGSWQARWLGDSATRAENRRARLAPVMLDVAWALFELRMHRDPARDPNAVWTALTRDYLHIAPHPELSWWAMRGQLIDSPGYMMNYAVGAIITADVRARASALGGPFSGGLGERWYAWLSARLYRFGLAKSSGDVLREFLGRDLSPEALLREIDGLSS